MPVTKTLPEDVDAEESAEPPAAAVGQPYKRGYRTPAHLRSRIAAAHQTNLPLTVGVAILDHAVVTAAALVVAAAGLVAPWPVVCLAVALAAIVMGRQLRALENLVHEGSHYNWDRGRRRLNDACARWLAGFPTGGDLLEYRAGHLLHHGRFGTAADPDLARYRELSLEELDRSSVARFAGGLLRRFHAYQRGWLRASGANPVRMALPALYGAAFAGLPSFALAGWRGAVWAGVAWTLAYGIALPLIRLVAEAGEHRYTGARTVFDATYSNLGFWHRWVFHPHNDGYHTIHHMWPGVPHHHLRRLHRILFLADADGYATRLRYRVGLLERE